MSSSTITSKDFFDRLGELQKQLADVKDLGQAMREAIEAAAIPEDVDEDDRAEIIGDICEPFNNREVSLQRLIEVYEKMLEKLG